MPTRQPPWDIRARSAVVARVSRSPIRSIPGLHKLDISFANRFERYSDVGNFSSPYLGFAWSPIAALTVQGSLAESFRAPDFPERSPAGDSVSTTVLPDNKSSAGVSTALLWTGGNANLRAERARSWNLGFTAQLFEDQPASFSLHYFHVTFSDRIVEPPSARIC